MSKVIGKRTILHGIDLRVARNEFVALFGPNGAGKTTLMKILAGLMKPSSGTVRIGGENWSDTAGGRLRSRIGVISHHTFLYDGLSARENLAFFGRMYGIENRQARIDTVLDQVGLALFANDLVRTFSRGMQQRLSIARALLHDPEVLYLDEPYSGLDQRACGTLTELLRTLKERGRTVIMITHNFEEGLSLADRVVILNRGKIVFSSDGKLSTEELKSTYMGCVG